MTQPHEVSIKARDLATYANARKAALANGEDVEAADAAGLAAFLAARVPDAKAFGDDNRDEAYDAWVQSHNALRAAVLRGLDQ